MRGTPLFPDTDIGPGTPPPPPNLDEMELYRLAAPEARQQGVPVDLVMRVIKQESRPYGNPRSLSPKGAQGLMQLMPATSKSYGVTDPYDPVQNIRAGVTHLGKLLKQYKGDHRFALLDYNGGPAAVQAFKEGRAWRESQGYLAGTLDPTTQPGTPPPPVSPASTDSDQMSVAEQMEAYRQAREATPQSLGVAGPERLPDLPGGPPPKPDDPRIFSPGRASSLGMQMAIDTANGLNPTTNEGRRNYGGMAGAALAGAGLAATVATGGADLPFLIPAAVAATGAGVGGAAEEKAEQMIGTSPPSDAAVGRTFTRQAGGELLGRVFTGTLQAAGRRMLASRVSKNAVKGLSTIRRATMDRLSDALDAASGILDQTKEAASAAKVAAQAGVKAGVDAARGTVDAAKQALDDVTSGATFGPYKALVNQPPPSAVAAGEAAQSVIKGPAKAVRDELGQAVGKAAEEGPTVDNTGFKAEAQKLVDRLLPGQVAYPARAVPVESNPAIAAAAKGADVARTKDYSALAAASPEYAAMLAEADKAAQQGLLNHPVMKVLRRILDSPDTVSFAEAHAFKEELGDALRNFWDKVANKDAVSMTQHLYGQLSSTLNAHPPYGEATAAYAKVAKLFTKGMAPQLKRAAIDNPEVVVGLINPKQPTKFRMLRDLLTLDGSDQGQQAWNMVRAAWADRNLARGGIEGLRKRLDLSPDFEAVFAHDADGQQVLSNLRSIADAYDQAVGTAKQGVQTAERDLADTQAEGAAKVAATATRGEQKVSLAEQKVGTERHALEDAKKQTAAEQEFLESSLAPKNVRDPEQYFIDEFRAMALNPVRSYFGLQALVRVLHGPKSSQLLRWAEYSPEITQLIVKVLTSRVPPAIGGEVTRAATGAGRLSQPTHVGQPPPAPR